MRPPERSEEERMEALEIATAKRQARAELLSQPDLDIPALLEDPPECLVGSTIFRLLEHERSMGAAKATRLLRHLKISQSRKIVASNTGWQKRIALELRVYRLIRDYNNAKGSYYGVATLPVWAQHKKSDNFKKKEVEPDG